MIAYLLNGYHARNIFYVKINKLLNKMLSCWWFEMPWRSCDVIVMNEKLNLREAKICLALLLHCLCKVPGINLELTHLPLVLHIYISESGQHWYRQWFVAYLSPSHYLNQCWVIANWTLRNKLQWNFNQNTQHFIHKTSSANTVCEMAAILSRGRWVNLHTMWCWLQI